VFSGAAHLIRLGRAGFVFAREGVFGIIDPAAIPVPMRPLIRMARLFERRSTGTVESRL
jgi:ubiquinone biosynthesis protein